MAWLDDLLGKTILSNGVPLPDRKLLNIRASDDVQVVDNPQTQSTDLFINGAAFIRAYGDVIGAVDISSGEDTNSNRPPVLTSGDYSAYPFQHLLAAVSALPLHLGGYTLRLNLAAGSYAGAVLGGFIGGTLELCGTWATPTIGSGVTSGTAGSGTAGTALNKPTAAPSWPNDGSLVGLKVVITGGLGFTGSDAMTETVRIIKAHTATQLTLDQPVLGGIDNTTQFALVEEGVIIDDVAALTVDGDTCLFGVDMCHSRVVLRRIRLDNSALPAEFALRTMGVRIVDVANSDIRGDWWGSEVDSILWSSVTVGVGGVGGEVQFTNCGRFFGKAFLTAAAHLLTIDFKEVTAYLVAKSCLDTALRAQHCNYVGREIDANGCASTPLEMTNVQYSEPVGNGLTGTNASAAFAVFITAGGRHVLTGSTMTSSTSNQVDLDGKQISWTDLTITNFMRGGTFAFWSDNLWKLVGKFGIDNDSSQNYGDLFIRDLQVSRVSRTIPDTNTGGGDYSQGAYAEVIPNSAGTQVAATVVGFKETLIRADGGTADGHAVRFFVDGDNGVAGTGFGDHGGITNGSGHIIRLFPPSGKKIFQAAVDQGIDNYIELGAGRVSWLTDKDGNWWVD